jgi:CubicO group peptidase (beta-lactamase class C family)
MIRSNRPLRVAAVLAVTLWSLGPAGRLAAQTPLGVAERLGIDPDVGVAPGAPPRTPLPRWAGPAILAFESRLAADVAADQVGAMAAAVFVGGNVVWQAAFGVADRETSVLAEPESVFRAGSISKPVTALALLALAERGMVSLDDAVELHLPEVLHLAGLPAGGPPITFRHLATHTAGLAREPGVSHAGRGAYADWRDRLITAIPFAEVVRPPGEAYHYSNVGYALLGLALERAAGKPYEALVRELVLDPLGMSSSWFQVPAAERWRLAEGYVNPSREVIDPRVPRAEHLGRGYRPPSGGLYSTAGDLARLGMAMAGAAGDLPIGHGLRAAALSDGGDPGGIALRSGYGLGFQLHRLGPTLVAGHSGRVPGYAAYLAFDPVSQVGVVLLRSYNHGRTNLGAVASGLVLELAAARP